MACLPAWGQDILCSDSKRQQSNQFPMDRIKSRPTFSSFHCIYVTVEKKTQLLFHADFKSELCPFWQTREISKQTVHLEVHTLSCLVNRHSIVSLTYSLYLSSFRWNRFKGIHTGPISAAGCCLAHNSEEESSGLWFHHHRWRSTRWIPSSEERPERWTRRTR